MTQGRPGRVKLFYKRQAEEKGVGRRHILLERAAPLQFSHSALLVLMRAACPEVGLLSPLPAF